MIITNAIVCKSQYTSTWTKTTNNLMNMIENPTANPLVQYGYNCHIEWPWDTSYIDYNDDCTLIHDKNKCSHMYPKSCNHKRISIYYILVSITNALSGTMLSIIIRMELEVSSNRILSTENLNVYLLGVTIHGFLMIFFLIMPSLIGSYGNYLMPIKLGWWEIIYPRINNLSVWIIPISYVIIMLSMLSESSSGLGWTLYPPLSTQDMTLTWSGIEVILYALIISGVSTSLTSINFIISIYIWKPIIIPLTTLDIYLWSLNLIGYLLILVLPILSGILIMLIWDVHYNTIFFDWLYGGDPIFYQHLFWIFGHPEVHILIIPGFGIISTILSEHHNCIIFGYISMILAMWCIIYLGSLVWSHHMFTIGLEVDSRGYFMSSTMLISLPTGSKMFNWLCTHLSGLSLLSSSNNITIVYIKMFLIMFIAGGSTGIIIGNNLIDISLHDSYYVVSHFHIVLSLGALLSIIWSISHYQEYLLIFGISITNVLSSYHLKCIIIGIFLTFIPLHFVCFNTLPRRISDFPESIHWWNSLSSLGCSLTWVSLVILRL